MTCAGSTASSADIRSPVSKEIDKLGVASLAIELRKEKPRYGVPYFRVSLMRKPEARVGDILSEGEHRCVALAAFLAELATTEGHSAIVFDDPVSSLDHVHREAMAQRLPDELQQPSTFSTGIMERADNPEAARRLIEFLSSEAVASIVESTGLRPVVWEQDQQ